MVQSESGLVASRDITEELNALDAMTWKVLRNAMVRALAGRAGKDPEGFTNEELQALLEPYTAHLMNDCATLREAYKQAFLLGVRKVHEELHGAPGVDHERLEETIEFFSEPKDGDGEALKP